MDPRWIEPKEKTSRCGIKLLVDPTFEFDRLWGIKLLKDLALESKTFDQHRACCNVGPWQAPYVYGSTLACGDINAILNVWQFHYRKSVMS